MLWSNITLIMSSERGWFGSGIDSTKYDRDGVRFIEDHQVKLSRDTYNAYQIANGGEIAGASAFPRTIEWEFSSNVIIINTRINSDDPVSIRQVIYGSFKYRRDEKSLYSAKIDNVYTVYRHDDGFEYGFFDDPGFRTKVTEINFAAWDTAMSKLHSGDFVTHEYQINNGQSVDLKGDGYAGIFSEVNGLFLQEDWHQKLFSSNLLQGLNCEVQNPPYDLSRNWFSQPLRGSSTVNDVLIGDLNDNKLVGLQGADILFGNDGNDELRAGNGRDIITGGDGSDTMYGGFGLNTFENEADGAVDSLYFKSDQWAENWLYEKAGNSPDGQKADKITELDSFDRINVQGVATSQLSYRAVSHQSNLGETLSGIGIYASGYLEAVYVGDNLSLGQIAAMTQGVL